MFHGRDAPSPTLPALLVAAAALVDGDGRVLVQRRPPGRPLAGRWEFPGGKVETGEAPAVALVRELREELGIAVDPVDAHPLAFAEEAADRDAGAPPLVLLFYWCRRWAGEPAPLAATEMGWVRPGDLAAMEMPAPDRPLAAALVRFLEN